MLYHTYQANYLNADFAILQTGAYIIYIAKTFLGGWVVWGLGWGWQWVKIFIDITYPNMEIGTNEKVIVFSITTYMYKHVTSCCE